MFNIVKKESLHNCKDSLYQGALFCNNNYYFTNNKNKFIDIYNSCLEKTSYKKTCSPYNSITNACKCENFYVTKKEDTNYLYLLNEDFLEIDKILLHIPDKYHEEFLSIAYDRCNCKIILATNTKVFSVTLDGYFIKDEISDNSVKNISTKSIQKQMSKSICGCYTPLNYQNIVPFITSVGIFCGKKYIAYTKDNSAYISLLSNNGNIIETYYIEDHIQINAFLINKHSMELFVTKNDTYKYIYKTNYICCCKNNCDCCCDCEEIICDKCECCQSCPDYIECESQCSKNSCDNVIESIALIETALSHVLNAEGEKIQKAVQESKNICELVEVNNSVNKVIFNTSMLEQILFDKLKLVLSESSYCNELEDYEECNDCEEK